MLAESVLPYWSTDALIYYYYYYFYCFYYYYYFLTIARSFVLVYPCITICILAYNIIITLMFKEKSTIKN